MARGTCLGGDHGHYGGDVTPNQPRRQTLHGPCRRCYHRPFPHRRHRRGPARMESARHLHSPEGGRRRRANPPRRTCQKRPPARPQCGPGGKTDSPPQTLQRRDFADRDGDGRQVARRQGTLAGHEGLRAWHAGNTRGDHRDPDRARIHRARRQGAASHRQGHPADRRGPPRRQESGDDRTMGSPPARRSTGARRS